MKLIEKICMKCISYIVGNEKEKPKSCATCYKEILWALKIVGGLFKENESMTMSHAQIADARNQ